MRRTFRETLMSAASLAILLLVLVAVDDRLREEISRRLTTRPTMALAGAGQQVSDLAHAINTAARSQSLTQAPVLIFALAAGVLVVFMLRT